MTSLRTLLAGLFTALLTAVALVALTPAAAHACSCAVASPRQYDEWADVVFTGTLTAVDPPPQRAVMSSGDPATYHFDVDGVLKGVVPPTTEVSSAVSGASCGLEGMFIDRRYVVYAHGVRELSADLCGGTAPIGPAAERRLERVSGPARAPDPAASRPSGGPSSSDGPAAGWVLVGAAGLVTAGAAGVALRRRRAVG
jgi:hypothetical protein